MLCPQCSQRQGSKYLLDNIKLIFECWACGFKCPMKIYRYLFITNINKTTP